MAPLVSPWPRSAARLSDGEMTIGDQRAHELLAQFGSPLYVIDEADMRGRAAEFRSAFEAEFSAIGSGIDVYYAGKAFLSVAIARWMVAEGLRIDTATEGELATALRAAVPGSSIGLHGNNKSDAEIELALRSGVGRLVIDSLGEIERVAAIAQRLNVVAPVLVRVTTGVHAGGHEYISTAHEDQKFGLSLHSGPAGQSLDGENEASAALVALESALAQPSLHLLGIHSHIGSQILDPAGFAVAAEAVMRLRSLLAQRTGYLVPEVDLGGGFGIGYLPGEVALEPARMAKELASAVVEAAAGAPLPRFSIEPGRAIAAPAGITLYTVGTVKPVRTEEGLVRTYVSVDGGMSDNIRPALYGAAYHAELASRSSQAPATLCRVVGKHCESGDIVVHEIHLPSDIAPGDVLAVAATGAYGRSMASNYNLVPRPGVVAVADGSAREIVRRESIQDLLALDLG